MPYLPVTVYGESSDVIYFWIMWYHFGQQVITFDLYNVGEKARIKDLNVHVLCGLTVTVSSLCPVADYIIQSQCFCFNFMCPLLLYVLHDFWEV